MIKTAFLVRGLRGNNTIIFVLWGVAISIAAVSLLLFAIELLYPAKTIVAGEDIFTKDNLYIYTPDNKSTFIPDRYLEIISVKENIVHDKSKDTFNRVPAEIQTVPFRLSRFMAIPLLGGGENPTIFDRRESRVYLHCLSNNLEQDLLNGPSEGWFLAIVSIDNSWCPGEVVLRAKSTSQLNKIGLGSPLEVSWWTWVLSGPLGVLLAASFAVSLICAASLPILSISSYSPLQRVGLVLVFHSACGIAWFLQQWYLENHIGAACVAVFYTVGPLIGALTAREVRPRTTDMTLQKLFILSLTIAVLIIVVLPYVAIPIGNGFWFPAYAFFPASWSTDNLLSVMTAKSLLKVGSSHPDFLGHWSLTDRGLVQAGSYVGLLSFPIVGQIVQGTTAAAQVENIYGAAIQALTVPALLVILKWLRPNASALLLFFLIIFTPFVLMNVFYIWPKLSGAILIVTGVFILDQAIMSRDRRSFLLGICCLAFGPMNHSSNLFSLLCAGMYVPIGAMVGRFSSIQVLAIIKVSLSRLIILLCILAVILWFGYKVEPQSGWPMLFLLTGTGEFGLSAAQIHTRIAEYFSSLSPGRFFSQKLMQLSDLVWVQDPFFARSFAGFLPLATIRARQFFSLVPSFGFGAIVSFFAALGPSKLPGAPRIAFSHPALVLGASSFAALAIYVLLAGMPMVVHQIPYGIVLGIFIFVLSIIGKSGRLLLLAAAIQSVSTLLIFYFGANFTWLHELQ